MDGDDQEMEDLVKAFQDAGLAEHYHGIVTSKLVQTMDPLDLVENLVDIYNFKEERDPNNLGVTRIERLRQLIRYTERFMQGAITQMNCVTGNFEQTRTAFQNHASRTTDTAHPGPSDFYPSESTGIKEMENALALVRSITPKEGEEW